MVVAKELLNLLDDGGVGADTVAEKVDNLVVCERGELPGAEPQQQPAAQNCLEVVIVKVLGHER